MTIKEVRDKIDDLKRKNEFQRGRKSRLFDRDFCKILIDAIKEYNDNGYKIFYYLRNHGIKISYKQAQDYVKKIFGSFSQRGRPAKFLGENIRSA